MIEQKSTGKIEPLITRIREQPFRYIIIFLFLINITLVIINIGLWFLAAHQKLFITADFTNLYTGFKMVMNGDGSKLYDLELQARYQQIIMGNITFEGGLLPYVTPPFIAVLFSPLSLFPISTAFYIWTIGEMGLLIWLIFLLNHLFSDWTKQERLIMVIAILAFWPLTLTFILGQFSLLFLICVLQIYVAMRDYQVGKAGIWLILLSIKPQILPIPGMMTLNKKYWKIAVAAAISGVALFIFSSIFLGFGIWRQYIEVLPTMSNYFGRLGFFPEVQYTLRGLLTNILGYSQANRINLISIGVLIGVVVFVWLFWMRVVQTGSQKFILYFSFTILLSLLLSLHSYHHDDLILVLPAALFYDYLRDFNFPRKAYSILILLSPLIFFIAEFYSINLFGVIRPPIIILLILLVWMIYYLIHDHQKEEELPVTTITTNE